MPKLPPSRRLAAAAVALSLLTAAACGDDDDASDDVEDAPTTVEETTTTTEADDDDDAGDDDTDADDDGDDAAAGDGDTAEWAKPYEVSGDLLTTIEGDDFQVEVYQVGTTPSPKDGNWVDPDTNESLIVEGDDLVFVQFVVTNTGDDAISLSHSLVAVTARYADWEWAQGMDSITDSAMWEEMGVENSAIAPGNTESPFSWEPGTSFAYGTNFKYQPGSEITFSARLTPADENGDLDHDQRQEVEAQTTIQ